MQSTNHWHTLNSLLDEILELHTRSLGVPFNSTNPAEYMASIALLPGYLAPVLAKYNEGKALAYSSKGHVDLYTLMAPSFKIVETVIGKSPDWASATEMSMLFEFTNTFLKSLFAQLSIDLQAVVASARRDRNQVMECIFEILGSMVEDANTSDLTMSPDRFTDQTKFSENYKLVITAFHTYSKRILPVLYLLFNHLKASAHSDPKQIKAYETVSEIRDSLIKIEAEFPDS